MAEFLLSKNSVLQTGVSDLIHPSVKFRRGSKAEKGTDLFSEKKQTPFLQDISKCFCYR
jgi:hypothetical protein